SSMRAGAAEAAAGAVLGAEATTTGLDLGGAFFSALATAFFSAVGLGLALSTGALGASASLGVIACAGAEAGTLGAAAAVSVAGGCAEGPIPARAVTPMPISRPNSAEAAARALRRRPSGPWPVSQLVPLARAENFDSVSGTRRAVGVPPTTE